MTKFRYSVAAVVCVDFVADSIDEAEKLYSDFCGQMNCSESFVSDTVKEPVEIVLQDVVPEVYDELGYLVGVCRCSRCDKLKSAVGCSNGECLSEVQVI